MRVSFKLDGLEARPPFGQLDVADRGLAEGVGISEFLSNLADQVDLGEDGMIRTQSSSNEVLDQAR